MKRVKHKFLFGILILKIVEDDIFKPEEPGKLTGLIKTSTKKYLFGCIPYSTITNNKLK